MTWLEDAVTAVAKEATAIRALFPAAGRRAGRDNADEARAALLLALSGESLAKEVAGLYHHGDNDEKRAVLKTLPSLDVGDGCVELLRDALRSNDSRLIAAALGPYSRHLADAEWRQGVLKSVFMGLPLSSLHGLDERADAELARMLGGLRDEREAAGRVMPADAVALLERLA
ncbi:EboA domain-containing protein [Catelliglobosispora koreensis]|uniref:EboA domain-containing protein n=1 Tax=Catelliglobosispora koreensis TaxID=129052 RepID=UPI00035F8B9D|nr:EboA domain-containing protein [Catelliglobosispora koreensis]